MEVLCIIGATPGPVTATLSHEGNIRQLAMDVARHPAGGWRARLRGGEWGLRCHAVTTCVLLEGAEAFQDAAMALAAD